MDHPLLEFLLRLAAMLGVARLLGELARACRMPPVVGEIVAGVLLGPTVLGRIAPGVWRWLLSPHGGAEAMMEAYKAIGVILLLVVVGLELDVAMLRRQGPRALATAVAGVVLPAACGVGLGLMLPASDLSDPSQRGTLAALLAVALSISALPVIAKVLLDLGLFRSEVGMLVMSAASVDDVLGWTALSFLLGRVRGAGSNVPSLLRTVVLAAAFVFATIVLARRVLAAALRRLQRARSLAPERVLSVVVVLALLGGSVTRAIGLHEVFGGYVVGLAIGHAGHVDAKAKDAVRDFVRGALAPVFFASMGTPIDFVRAFDVRLVSLVLLLATVPKVTGCALGARAARLPWRQALATGFGMNARGAMELILAAIAREAGALSDALYVALVVMAVVTSVVAGPAMKALLGRDADAVDLPSLLRAGAFVGELQSRTAQAAVGELVLALRPRLADAGSAACDASRTPLDAPPIRVAGEAAVAHAAVDGLDQPLLALGRSRRGVDAGAADGSTARLVLVLLSPAHSQDQVPSGAILESIADVVQSADTRRALMEAPDLESAARALTRRGSRLPPSGGPRRSASQPA